METKYNKLEASTNNETDSIHKEIEIYSNKIKNHKSDQQNLMLKKIALKQNVMNSEKEYEFIIQRKKKFAQMKDMYVKQFRNSFSLFVVAKNLQLSLHLFLRLLTKLRMEILYTK